MPELNETPRANRIHIAFFGLRNAGKSTLVNAFTGQPLAIVSDTPGTTTDPVSKAMEILPLGPCLVTDTAGLDDVGELGRQRVEKTLKVLETTDIAVWVDADSGEDSPEPPLNANPANVANRIEFGSEVRDEFLRRCAARKVTVLEYRRGDSVEELKKKIAAVKLEETTPGLLDGLVRPGDRIVCVCPIDESAPKGRLILPQVQLIRAALDLHATCTVCQPEELRDCLESGAVDLVVTDSQAFRTVDETLEKLTSAVRLTSFSILFARQKGDIAAYKEGLARLAELKDGDRVLVAEGCTHHRQCNDIGTVKIPKAVTKLSGGRKLEFVFASGTAFDTQTPQHQNTQTPGRYALIVQCGGCMLTRREVLRRIAVAREAGIPIVNYGMVLALAAGVEVEKCVM